MIKLPRRPPISINKLYKSELTKFGLYAAMGAGVAKCVRLARYGFTTNGNGEGNESSVEKGDNGGLRGPLQSVVPPDEWDNPAQEEHEYSEDEDWWDDSLVGSAPGYDVLVDVLGGRRPESDLEQDPSRYAIRNGRAVLHLSGKMAEDFRRLAPSWMLESVGPT